MDELTKVGPYQILNRIGRGGMGVLYRGLDPVLDREVAIKVMSADFLADGGDDARARFFREAKAAAKLQHRNIVTIFEYGEDGGLAFIVMEYLRGQSLSARLKATPPLRLDEKLDVAIELCTGLEFAHRNGVVHRDVKPANIWLSEDGTVKLLDFGIAKLASSTLTTQGELLGTVAYMAPEQISGSPADVRSDLFSTAVVLYEMVGGRRPFEADSPTATIHRVLHDTPAPIEALAPDVPLALSAVIERGLSKHPDDRFQTAADLAMELQTIRIALRSSGETNLLQQQAQLVTMVPHADPADRTIRKPQLDVPSSGTTVSTHQRSPWAAAALVGAVVLVFMAAGFAWSRLRAPTEGEAETVKVTPGVVSHEVMIESNPIGAAIRVDGTDTGLQTPNKVTFTDTEPHLIALTRAGYQRVESSLTQADYDSKRVTMTLTREGGPITEGTTDKTKGTGGGVPAPTRVQLVARAPSESTYPFEVRAGENIVSPMGVEHSLTVTSNQQIRLVNDAVFLNLLLPRDWAKGGVINPPALGKLRVVVPEGAAYQSCPVYLDGRRFGEVGELKTVVAGMHEIELRCEGNIRIIVPKEQVDVAKGDRETRKRVG